MFTRTFHARQFLLQVYGTEPFIEYCRQRGIRYAQSPGWVMQPDEEWMWHEAVSRLQEHDQATIELELSQVNELATPEALSMLLAAVAGNAVPPDDVPSGVPTALWYFLHHPALFQQVFLQQEIAQLHAWRMAQAPAGIPLGEVDAKRAALAQSLRDFFALHEGTGRFCAVEAHTLDSSCCFAVHLADRLRLLDVFNDDGGRTTLRSRPAFTVLFVYRPGDGRVLLKARQRARDRILDLFQRFGEAVLGVTLHERSLLPAFRLDRFKVPVEFLPDAPDMLGARVKALHFLYPGRLGRRRLKLETLSSDSPSAIPALLREHGGREEVHRQLCVCYVELLVQFQLPGGTKNQLVRLWPDRSNLDHSPLGERLTRCLQRWGILYA